MTQNEYYIIAMMFKNFISLRLVRRVYGSVVALVHGMPEADVKKKLADAEEVRAIADKEKATAEKLRAQAATERAKALRENVKAMGEMTKIFKGLGYTDEQIKQAVITPKFLESVYEAEGKLSPLLRSNSEPVRASTQVFTQELAPSDSPH